MNELDRMARDIMRQARTPAQAPRVTGGGGVLPPSGAESSTRVGGGAVKRLFVPDYSPLDDNSFYLGDSPLGDNHDA
jgi:hypothetical protein